MVEKTEKAETINNKRNNDPWLPLPEDETLTYPQPIAPAPRNPLTELIDSERYIQTLERRLGQLTKVRRVEPSSRDIITSLAMFHDDQMRRYISETDIIDFSLARNCGTDEPLPQASFVQRKLHPEKQPLTAEEIAELVKEDVLAKVFEATMNCVDSKTILNNSLDGTQHSMTQNSTKDLECSTITDQHQQNDQESGDKAASDSVDDWANFNELDKDIQDVDDSHR